MKTGNEHSCRERESYTLKKKSAALFDSLTHTQVKFNNELNKAYPFWKGLFANGNFVTNFIRDG